MSQIIAHSTPPKLVVKHILQRDNTQIMQSSCNGTYEIVQKRRSDTFNVCLLLYFVGPKYESVMQA